jgi:hypothetical protein
MVGLEPIVRVLIGTVPGRWRHLVEHRRIHRRLVGDDLDRGHLRRADCAVEEPTSRRGVPPRGDEHVDDLPELVDRPVDVTPLPGNLDIRFVELAPVADRVPERPCRSAKSGANRCTQRKTVT